MSQLYFLRRLKREEDTESLNPILFFIRDLTLRLQFIRIDERLEKRDLRICLLKIQHNLKGVVFILINYVA